MSSVDNMKQDNGK